MLAKRPRPTLAGYLGISMPEGAAMSSVNLTRIGILYIVAALFQATWPYLVYANWDMAREFLKFPAPLGWALAGIWIGMLWCIPHLFVLGARMVWLSRDRNTRIIQTTGERRRMSLIATLLVIGIALDLILFPALLGAEDKGVVILLTGMMGGRVLQANMEAILQYHRM